MRPPTPCLNVSASNSFNPKVMFSHEPITLQRVIHGNIMRTNGESKPKRLHDARKFSLSNLKGQQWATGKTEEDALEKVEEGLG
jgi:hypothetical protein